MATSTPGNWNCLCGSVEKGQGINWQSWIWNDSNEMSVYGGFLEDKTSIVEGTIYAILECLEVCKNNNIMYINLWVLSGGLKLILKEAKQNSRLKRRLFDELNSLGKSGSVRIHFIERGSDCEECCAFKDDIKGLSWPTMEPWTIKRKWLKKKAKSLMVEEWNAQWAAEQTCRQTKRFWPSVDLEVSRCLLKMSREDLSKVIQVVTGHGWNRYHLCTIGKETIDICRLCGNCVEDTWHLLNNCPGLLVVRRDLCKGGRVKWPQDLSRLPQLSIDFLFDPDADIKEWVNCHALPLVRSE